MKSKSPLILTLAGLMKYKKFRRSINKKLEEILNNYINYKKNTHKHFMKR